MQELEPSLEDVFIDLSPVTTMSTNSNSVPSTAAVEVERPTRCYGAFTAVTP
jgi:hypothetical protein